MFRPPLSNPTQKRTLRPLYANHQATPYGGFLDPNWANAFDILPGTVMTRLYGEVFAPYTGAANTVPFGLSALFKAPNLGVDEVTASGTNLFTIWNGDQQAVFEILAPAFDTGATWPAAGQGTPPGKKILLTGNAQGKLTPGGAAGSTAIAELIDVISADKIVVKLLPIVGA